MPDEIFTPTPLRPFTKTDWYGWAGATPFSDGSEPLYGEITVDGRPACIVADCSAVQVYEDPEEGGVWWELPFATNGPRLTLALAGVLYPGVTTAELRQLGFRRCS